LCAVAAVARTERCCKLHPSGGSGRAELYGVAVDHFLWYRYAPKEKFMVSRQAFALVDWEGIVFLNGQGEIYSSYAEAQTANDDYGGEYHIVPCGISWELPEEQESVQGA
jgi:hypothetical protein